MSYSELSFAGPSLLGGDVGPVYHFHHIAAWEDSKRLARIRKAQERAKRWK